MDLPYYHDPLSKGDCETLLLVDGNCLLNGEPRASVSHEQQHHLPHIWNLMLNTGLITSRKEIVLHCSLHAFCHLFAIFKILIVLHISIQLLFRFYIYHFLLSLSGSTKVSTEVKRSHSVMSNSLRPHGLQPTRLLRPWDFPGKSTGMGCHFLLQGIFPTQGSNPSLPHCRQMLYSLSHQGRQGKYK